MSIEFKKAKKQLTKLLKIHTDIQKHNRKAQKVFDKLQKSKNMDLSKYPTFKIHTTKLEEKADLLEKAIKYTPFISGAKLLVSVSGGRTSAYMAHYLKEKYAKFYDLHFVFANTSQEHEETLKFINSCDLFFNLNLTWIESVQHEYGVGATYSITNFKDADRDGGVFENMIKKHGIPNMAFPMCTRELKIHPIDKYSKDNSIKLRAIGIRSDELERATPQSLLDYYCGDIGLVLQHRKHIDGIFYPLIEDVKSTKEDILTWWNKMPFDLKLKGEHYGNCVGCFKKSKRKLLTLAKDKVSQLDFLERMEEKYSTYIPANQRKGRDENNYFFRGHQSVKDLKKESSTLFSEYSDKFQPTLFSNDPQMDEDFSCNECGTIF